MENKLTITQAKEQGYKLCGESSNEFQFLVNINDVHFDSGKKLFLAEKEPKIFSFDKHQIADLLSEVIGEREAEETGRDNDTIYDAIIEIDFSYTENLIKQVLEKHPTYKLTDIELIQD